MSRLTRDETRLIIELLEREIYDLCARLDTDQECYVGHSQHDLAEERLEQAVRARDLLASRLPELTKTLHLIKEKYNPRLRDKALAARFRDTIEPKGLAAAVSEIREFNRKLTGEDR